MRHALRRTFEVLGTRTGASRIARRLWRDDVAVVAYHNVVPVEDSGRGDSSLHLPLPSFIEQVERLVRTHDIVDLRGPWPRPGRGRPRAVITFDDAYRGAVTLALPELLSRGIPAVVFVSPGLLAAPGTWWDQLAEAGLLSRASRARALERHHGVARAVRSAFLNGAPPAVPATYGIATEDELRANVSGGISVGSHAWEHEHLPSLARHVLGRSLERSLRWVRMWGEGGCGWLALPYGAGSPEVVRCASELGYTGVFRIEGGLWRAGRDGTRAPRINVPAGMSADGMELRTSGILHRR